MRKLFVLNKEIDFDEFKKIHDAIIGGYFYLCKTCSSYFLSHLNRFLKSEHNVKNDIRKFISGELTDAFKFLASILNLLKENATYQATVLIRPTIESITCLIILFRNTDLIKECMKVKQKISKFFNEYLNDENLKQGNKRKNKTKFLSNTEFSWANKIINESPVRIHHLLKYINYENFNNLYWFFDAAIHNSMHFYGYKPAELEFRFPISIVVFVLTLLKDLYNEIIKYCDQDLNFLNEVLFNTNSLFTEYLRRYGEFALNISVELKQL